MRKILSIALAVLMLLSVVSVGVFTVSAAESSPERPANARPIENGDDFLSMQAGGNYYLDADITIDFTYAKTFTGFFDGNGHTITTEYPIFSNLNGATICNLTIEGEIDDTELENVYVGALANTVGDTTIDNVHNTADVIGASKAYVGGLVGFCRGASDLYIRNSSNSGTLYGQGCGGIIADCDGDYVEITNCRNSGEFECIRSSSNAGFGGMVASSGNADQVLVLDGCVNTAVLHGRRIGGMLGVCSSKKILVSNCVNAGTVISDTNYAGGIGCNTNSYAITVFRNCVNLGTVQSFQSHVGGISSYVSSNAASLDGSISYYGCVNAGTVELLNFDTTVKGCNTGGITGKIYGRGEYYNCSNTGTVNSHSWATGLSAYVGGGSSLGGNVASGCYISGTINGVGDAYTSPQNKISSGMFGYVYSSCLASNSVVDATIKAEGYTPVPPSSGNTAVLAACVSYSNSTAGLYQNIHFVGELIAGDNVPKVVLLNSRGADLTSHFGNKVNNIYSAIDYPIYWNQAKGFSTTKPRAVDKALYTPEYTVALLNEMIGYEAYTIITDASSNEFGATGIFPTGVAEFFYGYGKAEPAAAPIGTAEEFLAMDANGNYYLTADITLPESYKGVFRGTLDGKGHTLTLSNPAFEVVSSADISNLTLAGKVTSPATDTARNATSYRGALAIVGVSSTLTKITNKADVTAYEIAGGIFGKTQGGEFIECVNEGKIVASTAIGGLVGKATHEIPHFEKCVNNGTFGKSAASASYIGGILGDAYYTDVYFSECVNNAKINITAPNAKVGGILGHINAPLYTTEIVNGAEKTNQQKLLVCSVNMNACVNNGALTGYGQTGGLVAYAEALVNMTNCVNNGEVTSSQDLAGGIVCHAGTSLPNPEALHTFKGCINNGKVVAHRQYVGGILAYSTDNVTFTTCTNNGEVTGEDVNYAGTCKNYKPYACHTGSSTRFVIAGGIFGRGYLDAKFEECVNLGNVSGNHRVGGIAGEIGYAATKGVDGKHEFLNCYVGGKIYNTNLYAAANAEIMNGTGGLFGLATNAMNTSITVQYCGVTADITGVIASKDSGPQVVAGLGGFCNTADATYQNNYFTGSLSTGEGNKNGIRIFIVYSDATLIRAASVKGNFTTTTDMAFYNDARGLEMLEKDFENLVSEDGVASGELAYRLYKSIGKDIFFQELGEQDAPMPFAGKTKFYVRYNEETLEYYNSNRPVGPSTPSTTTTGSSGGSEYEPPVSTEESTTEEITTEESSTAEGTTAGITTGGSQVTEPGTDAGTEAPADKGGCGSVVGASLAVAAVALVAPAVVMLKKRDEE